MIKPRTLKGFRDFLPNQAKRRQWLIDKLKSVFEFYGFEPLETPALEYEEILLGKYGDEGDKLMYRFEDNGKRRVALRYDQTVPLARVVATYQNKLPVPFKRYQIQNVWRAENTQKSRYREFLQVDADIAGSASLLADAEIIAVAEKCLKELGFKNFKIQINDRKLFKGLDKKSIIILDKLEKQPEDLIKAELKKAGLSEDLVDQIKTLEPTEDTNKLLLMLDEIGLDKSTVQFSPFLARGLDYYTGLIFEVKIEGYNAGSVAGGGRYDNLIGMFAGKNIPAVGFSFGFDRLVEAMEMLNLFPQNLVVKKVMVTIFPASLAKGSKELKRKSFEICQKLRNENINAEIYLNEDAPLEKQLKYADKKGAIYTIIIGPEEVKKNAVTIRNMKTRKQKTISAEKLFQEI